MMDQKDGQYSESQVVPDGSRRPAPDPRDQWLNFSGKSRRQVLVEFQDRSLIFVFKF